MHQMRRAKPAEFWETHIKKWKAVKNEPKSEYCKRHRLLETQFTYWINRVDTETRLTLQTDHGLSLLQTLIPLIQC